MKRTPACYEVLEDFETFMPLISGSFGNSGQLARYRVALLSEVRLFAEVYGISL